MNALQYEETIDYIGIDEAEIVYSRMIEDPEMTYEEKLYAIKASYYLNDDEIKNLLAHLDRYYFKDDEMW